MKTVFNQETRDELTRRINAITDNNKAGWGKMNLGQALRHCTLWDEWIHGDAKNKQAFIGRLFGKTALKKLLQDDSPLARNTPTTPELRIKETNIDIESEKFKWIGLINNYAHYTKPEFIHVFFGKMTKEQVGQLAYKHCRPPLAAIWSLGADGLCFTYK